MSGLHHEPDPGKFRSMTMDELNELVVDHLAKAPSLILVDGRSGSGKSTFAHKLAHLRGANSVATDDVAWHLHPTEWVEEMLEGIIRPWAKGEPVAYRPSGWVRMHRSGQIALPAGHDLIIEGVGAARSELAPFAHLIVWVHADRVEARRRGIARDVAQGRDPEQAEQFWDEWMSFEEPFLEAEQPWTRADLVVEGESDASTNPQSVRVMVRARPRNAWQAV